MSKDILNKMKECIVCHIIHSYKLKYFCTKSCMYKFLVNNYGSSFIQNNATSNSALVMHIIHPNQARENGLKSQRLYPDLYRKNMKKFNEEWKIRDIIGYKKAKSKAGKITHKNWKERDPIGYKKHQSLNGLKAIMNASNHKFLYHDPTELLTVRHYHRSKQEMIKCTELQRLYPKDWIHTNLHFNTKEIDFVISNPSIFIFDNPDTWLKVIEHHKVRDWQGETTESYITERKMKLEQIGVSCLIEVICV